MKKKLYLVLENGQIFEGSPFGAEGEITGEIVFNTSMTGYVEALTDPCYFGQIVVQTFPLIGNYGVMTADFESPSPFVKAYIVREWCQEPSNFRSEGNLDTFLKETNTIGLCGIDTRKLTKIIREHGIMNAKIVKNIDDLKSISEEIKGYSVKNAVKNTTCHEVTTLSAENPSKKVVLMDFGSTKQIAEELVKRGCEVVCVPANTSYEEILAQSPDGIVLSNGPGNPAENTEIIAVIAKLIESKLPVMGICLGHQLVALSQGAKTKKLKYGHRGANQPVKDVETGLVYITGQNHGYIVDDSTLPAHAKVTFVNANDNTCEGIEYEGLPVYTVQFLPVVAGGPRSTTFLYDRFITMMGGNELCR